MPRRIERCLKGITEGECITTKGERKKQARQDKKNIFQLSSDWLHTKGTGSIADGSRHLLIWPQ